MQSNKGITLDSQWQRRIYTRPTASRFTKCYFWTPQKFYVQIWHLDDFDASRFWCLESAVCVARSTRVDRLHLFREKHRNGETLAADIHRYRYSIKVRNGQLCKTGCAELHRLDITPVDYAPRGTLCITSVRFPSASVGDCRKKGEHADILHVLSLSWSNM